MPIAEPSPGLRKIALYFLSAWVLALLTRYPVLYHPMHSDYSMWLRVARDWADGQKLYEETYDNKQPTIFLFLRWIDWTNPKLSLYLAQTLLAAAAALVFWRALLATLPLAGWAAPLVLIAWTANPTTSTGGQTTETFALWFDVVALACFVLATRNGSVALMLASGFFFFVMVSLRIPGVLTGLAYLPFASLLFRERGKGSGLRLLGAFLAGIALGLLVLFVHAQALGYWSAFLEVLEKNYRYGSLTRVSPQQSVGRAFDILKTLAQENPTTVVLVGLTLVVTVSRLRQLTSHERIWLVTGVLWLLAAVASAFPGGRHFPHYYQLIWSPLSILAVLWLVPLRGLKEPPGIPVRLAMGVVAGVGFLALAQHAADWWKWRKTAVAGTDPVAAIEEAASYLEANTRPETVVPVCVWGHWAELYWRVSRPSVTRCTMPACIAEIEPVLFQEWVEAMLVQKPALIVADSCLVRPPNTRDPKAQDCATPAWQDAIAPVQRMVDSEYEVVYQVANPQLEGTLLVLARRDGPFAKKK